MMDSDEKSIEIIRSFLIEKFKSIFLKYQIKIKNSGLIKVFNEISI